MIPWSIVDDSTRYLRGLSPDERQQIELRCAVTTPAEADKLRLLVEDSLRQAMQRLGYLFGSETEGAKKK